jgi:hypothetical protein
MHAIVWAFEKVGLQSIAIEIKTFSKAHKP